MVLQPVRAGQEYNAAAMRSYLQCIPCFFEQTRRAAQLAGLNDATTWQVMQEFGAHLGQLDINAPPPENCLFIYRRIAELSGCADPYQATKAEHTRQALDLLDTIRNEVRAADDPLDMSVRLAAAGNRIDLGALATVDRPEALLAHALAAPRPIWALPTLKTRLADADTLLLLGDNAGETVFDRVLLETVSQRHPSCRRTFVARGGPIINDATVEDARAAGLDKVAELLSTGSSAPGVLSRHRSQELDQALASADLVISKGQGNFESLSDIDREVFFILTVKCAVVADHLSVDRGASVLIHHKPTISEG